MRHGQKNIKTESLLHKYQISNDGQMQRYRTPSDPYLTNAQFIRKFRTRIV